MSAFPSTAVLDNFNRANATTLGANWTYEVAVGSDSGNQAITANQLYNAYVWDSFQNYTSMYWNVANYGPDCEVYMTLSTVGGYNSNDDPSLSLRMTSIVQGSSGHHAGYSVGITDSNQVVIHRDDGGTSTQLGAAISQTVSSGDKLGARAVGSTISAYYNSGLGWNDIGDRIDATYNTAGKIGFYIPGNPGTDAWRFDDFGGGTYSNLPTFTVDGIIKAFGQTQSFTADGLLMAHIYSFTFTADALVANPPVPPDISSEGFVKSQKGLFKLNNKQFRFVGVNKYPMVINYMAQPDLAAFFAACKALGITVVRTWVFDTQGFRSLEYPAGVNMLANPSLETNATGYTFDADWSRSNDTAYDGTYSIKQNSAFNTYEHVGYRVTVDPNTDYIWTFYYKLANTPGSNSQLPTIARIGNDSGWGAVVDVALGLHDTGGTWQKASVVFNSGANSFVDLVLMNFGGQNLAYYDLWHLSPKLVLDANLVANNSFEIDVAGWSADADYTRSNDTAHLGSYAIKQVSTSGYSNFTTLNDATGIVVTPHTVYQFSVWMKMTINSGNAPIVYVNGGGAYGTPLNSSSGWDTSGSWAKMSFKFNSDVYDRVWIRVQNNGGNIAAYWDDFEVQAVEPPHLVQSEPQYAQLDLVLNEAKKAGVRLLLSFMDGNEFNYNSKSTYVSWANEIYFSGFSNTYPYLDFFTSSECQGLYKDFITSLLNRVNTLNGRLYSQDPNIFAWELGNELRINAFEDWRVNSLASPNLAILSNPGGWADIMSTFIKVNDPNHMVGFGDMGHGWAWYSGDSVWNGTFYGVDYNILSALPNMDYLDFHTYPDQNDNVHLIKYGQFLGYPNIATGAGYRAQLKDYVDVAKKNGKPVLIGEVGFIRDTVADNSAFPLYPRVATFTDIFDTFFNEGGDGILLWHGEIGDSGSYTVNLVGWDGTLTNLNWDDRPVQALIYNENFIYLTPVLPLSGLPYGYYLDDIQLKNPKTFTREFVYVKTDYTTLTGKTVRDTSNLKEKFTLGFSMLTKAQVDDLNTLIEKRQPIQFVVNGRDVVIINKPVWPFISSIVYEVVGSDYRATCVLELLEQQ